MYDDLRSKTNKRTKQPKLIFRGNFMVVLAGNGDVFARHNGNDRGAGHAHDEHEEIDAPAAVVDLKSNLCFFLVQKGRGNDPSFLGHPRRIGPD